MLRNKVLQYLHISLLIFGSASCGKKADETKLSPPVKTEKLRIFLIGNSFSSNATKYLPEIVAEKGKHLEIGRAEIGSGSLQNHWENATAYEVNAKDPKGLAYNGKSLKILLSESKWDVVSLQQYSQLSSDVSSYEPYASNLYAYIKAIQPQAKIVFHQTWAYRGDSPTFGRISSGQNAKTAQEMWERLRDANQTVASKLNAQIVPTGNAFWDITADPEWTFKKDNSIDPNKFVYPGVQNEPSSLHYGYTWTADKKVTVDYNHASTAGCYLGALVWYGFLFNADPITVKFKPPAVSEGFATRLKKAASNVLK